MTCHSGDMSKKAPFTRRVLFIVFAIARLLFAQRMTCEGFKMNEIGKKRVKTSVVERNLHSFIFVIIDIFCTFAPSKLKIGIK